MSHGRGVEKHCESEGMTRLEGIATDVTAYVTPQSSFVRRNDPIRGDCDRCDRIRHTAKLFCPKE